MSEETQVEEVVNTEVAEEVDSSEMVEGDDTHDIPAPPEIVERMMPGLVDIWEDLTPDKKADLQVSLAEMDKAATQQAVNPEKGAGGDSQRRPSDIQVPLYDFEKFNSEVAEKHDEGDFVGATALMTDLIKDNYNVMHAINDELSRQRDSQIPRDIQLALDGVEGATREDIKAATAIIQSGRAGKKEDAIRLAVWDRGGLVKKPKKPDWQRRERSRRASQHGKDSQPGSVAIPFTNNDDDIREMKIAEAEAQAKKSQGKLR